MHITSIAPRFDSSGAERAINLLWGRAMPQRFLYTVDNMPATRETALLAYVSRRPGSETRAAEIVFERAHDTDRLSHEARNILARFGVSITVTSKEST